MTWPTAPVQFRVQFYFSPICYWSRCAHGTVHLLWNESVRR